jgi:Protein of unknown function (DUF1559)
MYNFVLIVLLILIVPLVAGLFMSLIISPLNKLKRKIGSKKLSLILIALTVTVCLFLTLATALTFLIFLIALVAISLTNENKYIVFTLLTLYFFIVLGMILPPIGAAREPARRISCASNLKQIGTCLAMYAEDNNGHFPDKDGDAGFEMLIEQNYLSDYAVYLCPTTMDSESDTGKMKSSYIYHGGLTTSSPKTTILAQDRPGNHKGYSNYLYCNGAVKGINDPNYHDPDNESIIKRLFRWFGWR